MEQKLDGILSLLAARNQAALQTTPTSVSLSPPDTMSLDLSEIFDLSLPLLPMETAGPRPLHQMPLPTLPNYGFGGFQDAVSKCIVSAEQAEKALEEFAGRASTFPFVLLPPHTSLEALRHERPVFLLLILPLKIFLSASYMEPSMVV